MTSDGMRTFGYSSENLLTSSGGWTLAYDPLLRLSQTGDGTTTTRFTHDGANIAAEFDAAGDLLRRHVHGPGIEEPLLTYEGSGTSDRRFLHADERGSIVGQSNFFGDAQMVAINAYDDYGTPQRRDASGNIPPRFGFTGQAWLPEIGVYYYRARMYHPERGRFVQTDPIGYLSGMNLYAYVLNDPVSRTDPLGLCDGQGATREERQRPCDNEPIVVRAMSWHDFNLGVLGQGPTATTEPELRPGPLPAPPCSGAACMEPEVRGRRVQDPPTGQFLFSFGERPQVMDRRECVAVVGGIVAGGVYELVGLAVHVARGASLAELFLGGVAAAATVRVLVVAVVAGGTIYVVDRATDGAISDAAGRITGICTRRY